METDHGRFKTVTVSDNGLRPTFNLSCHFELGMQDMASLRFMVSDEDMFGDANIIAQNVYPLGSHDRLAIRTGVCFVRVCSGRLGAQRGLPSVSLVSCPSRLS
jgi:hypothetical protein